MIKCINLGGEREREKVSRRVSRDERLEIRHHVEITASKISTSVTVTVID